MEEDLNLEKFLELGNRNIDRGDLDRGIHYYNLALKKDLSDARVNLKLAEACLLKAETGGKAYLAVAGEALRRLLKADPRNEAAHEKRMVLALKTGTLGDLAKEYGEKARAAPGDELYAKYLKRAYTLSVLEKEPNIRLPEYAPFLSIKMFFDFLVLPAGVIGILMNNLGRKFKPFFLLGLTLFLFYCVYRAVLYMLLRRR